MSLIHPKAHGRLLLLGLLTFLLWGCTTRGANETVGETAILTDGSARCARLETDLTALLGYQDNETHLLARAILTRTESLARTYRVQPPALWHNFMVNLGFRDRGLCCHWTEDLLREIEAMNLRRYAAVWAVSRHGTWREHSSVVITVSGRAFETGLVLDPWRKAGDLFWVRVTEDSYPWQRHPGDDGASRIRCREADGE